MTVIFFLSYGFKTIPEDLRIITLPAPKLFAKKLTH